MLDKTFVLKGRQEPEWLLSGCHWSGYRSIGNPDCSYLLGKHKPTFTPGVDNG